ncbi:MAG: hypothetical protein OXC01_06070 [Immundisolibacterales bacterium]|nr:hypothetical protein [Immundisolibacterales bacterium]
MALTRRDVLRLGGAAAAAMLPCGAQAASNRVEEAIAQFSGGATPRDGGVVLEVPEIADNGGAVPVRVAAEGARRIALFADGNPSPGVVVFAFGSLATPAASTRIRLAGSQNVIAVAELADGTFRKTTRAIVVTAGGCG